MRVAVMGALAAGALAVAACATMTGHAGLADVDTGRIKAADREPGQWLSYGRTYAEQRYSPLDQIDTDNIGELGLAWYADYDTNQNQESTPLFIDGVLYVTTAWSKVYAFDARTGATLWKYDPRVPGEWNVNVCCGLVNRGAAAWNGKIIFATLDGRLIALDAATGERVWEVKAAPDGRYAITGAPRIADGRVFIGSAGGEFGVRGELGAYDAETGERLWRFWTVPGDPSKGFENDAMAMAAETWKTPGWWELGGGGPVWDSIIYDPTTDLVVFGTGNGSPWSAVDRDPGGGDNLFLSSIVAVHAEDGSYAWHYQLNPWETWDYDATQPLMTADLTIDGAMRHVLMQAPKNGFFYMLDATDGELISADPYTNMNWATGVDLATGRPNEVPEARYDVVEAGWNMLPGPAGAHNWQQMAYSPQTGLVYFPVNEMYFPFVADPDYTPADVGFNLGIDLGASAYFYDDKPDAPQGFTGHLVAFDPIAGREVWRSAVRSSSTGGVLAAAGGFVLQAVGSDQQLVAYKADTGEEIWRAGVGAAASAAPISYALDGEQYIAISVGGGAPGGYYAPNYSRLLVFKLGGTASLPEPAPFEQRPFMDVAQFASDEVVDHGRQVFGARCAVCHGQDGQARSTFPDLRRSPAISGQALFDAVVLGGVLAQNGMASFDAALDPPDTEALRAFLIGQAQRALAAAPPAEPEGAGVHVDPAGDRGD